MTGAAPMTTKSATSSFTGIAAALAVIDTLEQGETPEDATLPIRVGDLRELLRRYERAVEMKKGAEKKCTQIRRWWFESMESDSTFDPTAARSTDFGLLTIDNTTLRNPSGDPMWVVALDDEVLHSGGVPDNAYCYFAGMLTGMQYGDGT